MVSSSREGDLIVMDASSRMQFKRVKVGPGAGAILLQPNGARAYISCGQDNHVSVVDLKSWEVVGSIDVAEPDGLAWAVRP